MPSSSPDDSTKILLILIGSVIGVGRSTAYARARPTCARRMSNRFCCPFAETYEVLWVSGHSTPHDRGCHHVLFSSLSTETEVRLSTPALKSDPVAVHCRSSRVRIEVHVPLTESLTERQRVVRHQVPGTRCPAPGVRHQVPGKYVSSYRSCHVADETSYPWATPQPRAYLGRIVVCPPIYGRSTSGIVSEPSSFW